MHENIKAFHNRGTMEAMANVVKEMDQLVREIESSMRDAGYVPVLDLEPQFSRELDHSNDTYSFKVTVYGVQVKGKDAWEWAGISNGKLMKSSMKTK